MAVNKGILLASPVAVCARLCTIWSEPGFLATVGFSFSRIVLGFLLGLLLGCLFALAAGKWKAAETLLWPLFATIKSVPVASFIVICLIWIKSDRLSVFISFLIVLPVVYNNVLAGIRGIDKELLQMAELFRLPWGKRFYYIWLPALRGHLEAACSTGIGLAWKSGVAAEVIGIPSGSIGEMLYYAKVYLNSAELLCWTVLIVLLSVGFEKLFSALLHRGFERMEAR